MRSMLAFGALVVISTVVSSTATALVMPAVYTARFSRSFSMM